MAERLFLISFPCFQFIRKICKTRFSLSQKNPKMLKTKNYLDNPYFFRFEKFLLARLYPVWAYQKILPKEIEENWNQSQTDVKKWRCLSSFNLRLKALISEVTVEQQILALVCYVSVALIRKIAKRTRISTFDWGHWRALRDLA